MLLKKISLNLKVFLTLVLILGGCFLLFNTGIATEEFNTNSLEVESSVWTSITSPFTSAILAFLYGIFRLVFLLLAGAMWLLDVVISPEMFDQVFFSPVAIEGINNAWSFVRDFFNLFFILIIVLIGLSVILGVGKFKDKTILIRVAGAAMLINFSKPITLFFIDMSQVFTRFFAGNLGDNFSTNFLDLLTFSQLMSGETLKDDVVYMVTIIFVIIMTVIMAVMLFYLAISLIIRMIAFWVLIILSPFAFFGLAMEGTKIGSIKDDWIKDLISWCFYGPILLFFIWLALILVSSINEATIAGFDSVPSMDPSSLDTTSGGLSSFIITVCGMLIPYITAIYLLFYGYDKAKKTSSGLASSILGAGSAKISQINKMAKSKGYGAGFIAPKTRKGMQEGIKTRLENSPTFKGFTQKGKKEKQEAISAKWKRKIGGDNSAENELARKKIYEKQKEFKDDNKSKDELTKILTDQNKNKNDQRAAALLLSENNQLDSGENFSKAMKELEGHGNLQDKITRETKKENLGAVLDYEVNEDIRKAKKDGVLRGLDESSGTYKNEVKRMKTQKYQEEMNKKTPKELFKNQNKDFYIEKDQRGNDVIKKEVLDELFVKARRYPDQVERKKIASEIKNGEVIDLLRNSGRKGRYILGDVA